jgi:uncharacterized membrane protein YeaQ/YmgE (transglycosylase-associated protein family)
MHYIWMFLVGIVIGFIARLIMPGSEHVSILMTGVLGIAGSFVGGLIGTLVSRPADGAMFHPAGFVMSVLGALILLFVFNHAHL